jgi:Na+-driven multidrug efflux pump
VIAYDAQKAKLMAGWTMLLTAALAVVSSFSLHFFQLPIIRLFTTDDQVILQSQAIWPMLSVYVFILFIFGLHYSSNDLFLFFCHCSFSQPFSLFSVI